MRLKSNIWKLYAFKFFMSLHFFSAVLIPFFTEWGNLNLMQTLLLQSWFMLCIFLLEVPTGTIADHFGRKVSLSVAAFFGMIAPLIYASSPNIVAFMIGEFFFALTAALVSGADEALIYDTLKELKQEKRSKDVFTYYSTLHMTGIFIAGPIGSLMASTFGIRAPMQFITIPTAVAFFLTLTLKEPKYKKESEKKRYIDIMKDGTKYFIAHKTLKILAFDMIFVASAAYFTIWMYQPILLGFGMDISLLGFAHALIVLSEIFVMNAFVPLEKFFRGKKNLIFMTAFLTGAGFTIAAFGNIMSVSFLGMLIAAGFGLTRRPLFMHYMNKHIPSHQRATVLSSVSMVRRLVMVVLNPIIGALFDWSLSSTLLLLGVSVIGFSFFSSVKEMHLID